jgi:hypothetical protein
MTNGGDNGFLDGVGQGGGHGHAADSLHVSCTRKATTECLRGVMRRHYNIQKCLSYFNDVFVYFIILFILQVQLYKVFL